MTLLSDVRIGRQQPRLSQRPARAVGSAGDDAIEFAESIGFDEDTGRGFYELDDWQKFCIRGLLSEDRNAQLCALVSLILVTRQNGKNVILEVVELYAFYVLGLPLILHTAHLQETTADHMARLWAAIESDEELSAITKQTVANGKERIWRTDTRAQIKFKTRSKKVGRGGSPRMVVFDEALYLTDDQIQAMLPSLSAQSMRGDAPILIYTSSAPVAESIVLHRVRRAINEGRMPDAFMAEWSVELTPLPGESELETMQRVAADRDGWYESNPGMGKRISPDWVEANELPMMSLEAFLIERCGVVFDVNLDVGRPITAEVWDALCDEKSLISSARQWALAVSPDRQWASIGVAGHREDGKLHVEWMDHRPGTGWVQERIVEAWKKRGVPIRIYTGGPEAAFIAPLRAAEVEVVEVNGAEFARATGRLIDAAKNDEVRHLGQRSLDKALAGASLRMTEGGASAWSQRSTVEISPLMAVTIAAGGVDLDDESAELMFAFSK